MFSRRREPSLLDLATDKAIRELDNHTVGSKDYVEILEIVSRLQKLKRDETPSPVSRDTMAIVGANLLGILMIIRHEYINVISSRAMNLILKPK